MSTYTTVLSSGVHLARPVVQPSGVWARWLVDNLPHARLAHAPEWAGVISRAYGHEPLYLSGEDEEGRSGILPAFVVRRPLFGPVLTSMPFLDSGGPCSPSLELAAALVARLLLESRRIGARRVELRCAERLPLPYQPMESKVNLTLPLPADPDRLWRALDGSVRNQVRKAQRSGLVVGIAGPEELSAFYNTFAARMRDLGSPVHSRGFFLAILESFGTRARIVVVRNDRLTVAALLALAFRDRLIVPWAACLKEFFSQCANMLLYWETLRRACVEGFRAFDFGRSTRDSGTYRFKRQWGAVEEPLFWYTIPEPAHADASAASFGKVADLLIAAWRRLPLSVSRGVGPRIRKYLIQ
jgi:serine/alanine adding enzyme